MKARTAYGIFSFALYAALLSALGWLGALFYTVYTSPTYLGELFEPDYSGGRARQILSAEDAGAIQLDTHSLNSVIWSNIIYEGRDGVFPIPPYLRIDEKTLFVIFPVQSPLPGRSSPLALSFEGEIRSREYVLKRAFLGDALLPNFIGRVLLDRAAAEHVEASRDLENFFGAFSEIKIEDGILHLKK